MITLRAVPASTRQHKRYHRLEVHRITHFHHFPFDCMPQSATTAKYPLAVVATVFLAGHTGLLKKKHDTRASGKLSGRNCHVPIRRVSILGRLSALNKMPFQSRTEIGLVLAAELQTQLSCINQNQMFHVTRSNPADVINSNSRKPAGDAERYHS